MPRRPDMPPLVRAELDPDPFAQFEAWYGSAGEEEVPLRSAMTLSTVDEDGRPDARMVLLKGFDRRGFRFFTNDRSRKGAQLAARAEAALIIYWREQDRQVRIRGPVSRLPGTESDEYFASRPRDSQLGAWASPQSEVLADRAELDRRLAEVEARFGDGEVGRPPHWGGYVVSPAVIEFWQGQVGRLHDRFRYVRPDGFSGAAAGPAAEGLQWSIERLAP